MQTFFIPPVDIPKKKCYDRYIEIRKPLGKDLRRKLSVLCKGLFLDFYKKKFIIGVFYGKHNR